MGFLSSVVGGSEPTKYSVACTVASVIKHVLSEIDYSGLMAGRIVLNKDWSVAFRSLNGAIDPTDSTKVVASALILDLVSNNGLKVKEKHRSSYVDRLTFFVLMEFESQYPAYANLHALFKPNAPYAFNAMSAQYWSAAKSDDKAQMESLMKTGDSAHYLLEAHTSFGGAKARERLMTSSFPGGFVTAYEKKV